MNGRLRALEGLIAFWRYRSLKSVVHCSAGTADRALSDSPSQSLGWTVKVLGVLRCGYCQEFAGEAVVGESPLPPFHPSCTCVAAAA